MTADSPREDAPTDWAEPAALPFLPMIYMAWADGALTKEELDTIRQHLAKDDQHRLRRWLDPEHPPDASELAGLLGKLRELAPKLGNPEKLSLTELGVRVAAASDDGVSEAEREALIELQRALQIDGHEVARHLLATRRPVQLPERVQASFKADDLGEFLDGRHAQLRRRLRSLLASPEFALRNLPDETAHREQVLAWCQHLAAEGYGGLFYPLECGGAANIEGFLVAMETIALHDLSVLVKFGVQFGLFGGSILHLGTANHHRHYVPEIARLELPGCFAMTETSHGSNVQDIETTARFDTTSDCFIIHTPHDGARKDYIGNAACHGRLAVVFAQLQIASHPEAASEAWLDHGVHAFLVPIRDPSGTVLPGVDIEDCGRKLGLNGVDNGRIAFDRVAVPRENLLDRFAEVMRDGTYTSPIPSATRRFFTMLSTLVGGRLAVTHAAVSASKLALTIAVRYCLKRRQFGGEQEAEIQTLDYLTQQRRLFPQLARTFALHFVLEELRTRLANRDLDDEVTSRELEAMAAGFKAEASWHTIDTVQNCREACGGQGYLWVNRLADLKSDSDIFATFEGDNVVLLQLTAKSLLSGFKREFSHMGAWDLLRWASRYARTELAESNPIAARRTEREHLRSREFYLAALRYRAQRHLQSVARRLRHRIKQTGSTQEALIACQDHLLAAARAEVEQRLSTIFTTAIERAPESVRPVLTRLAELHALSELDKDRAFFLERGYFEGAKSKAIHQQVNVLCGEIRPQAAALVKAFNIPEALLEPTIGRQ